MRKKNLWIEYKAAQDTIVSLRDTVRGLQEENVALRMKECEVVKPTMGVTSGLSIAHQTIAAMAKERNDALNETQRTLTEKNIEIHALEVEIQGLKNGQSVLVSRNARLESTVRDIKNLLNL